MNKNYIVVIIMLFVLGCRNDKAFKEQESITFNIKKVNKEIERNEIFKYEELIKLDTIEDAIISKVNSVFSAKDRYFVLDKSLKTVFQFNLQGQYINKLDCVGNGPEEFASVMDLHIEDSAGTYLLLDNVRRRILRYSFDNKFVSAYKLKNLKVGAIHHLEKLSENIVALFCKFDKNRVVVYDLNKQAVLSRSDRVPKVLDNTRIPVDYRYSHFFKVKNKLCYFERWNQMIYSIDTCGIYPQYKVEFPNYEFLDVTKINGEKDIRKNFWSWYNGDWIRGLDAVSCINEDIIIEFSYKEYRYTGIYNIKSKESRLYKFEDLELLSKSPYKTSYINHNNRLFFTYNIIEQEKVLEYLEANFGKNKIEINYNPYILKICLKK